MIDYEETDECRKLRKEALLELNNSYEGFKSERKLMTCIFFLVPVFVPLFFAYIPVPNNSIYFHLLIDNINVLKLSNAVLGDNGYYSVTFWGYTFSIIYLVVVSPYIYHYQRKNQDDGFISLDSKPLIWLLTAFVLMTLFTQLADMSSTDNKLGRLFLGACYFWPFFYGYFIMPIFMTVFLIISLFIHKGRRADKLYESEYYSSYRKDN
jgi:hypothetical protein